LEVEVFRLRLSPQLVLSILLLASSGLARGAEPGSIDDRRQQLKQLLAKEWEYELRENPEFATAIGDYRYNDRWSDGSLAHVRQQEEDARKWISRFEAIDTTGFPEQEKLNRVLKVRNLKDAVEGIELRTYEMPVDQFYGAHLQFAESVTTMPFDSTKHYEDYLSRLDKLPRALDELVRVLRQGEKDELMPPRFLLEKTVDQCKSIAQPAGEANVFGQPVAHFPDAVPVSDRKRLHDSIVLAVDQEVRPAYTRLANFIAADYAPKGRTEAGVWSLPGGDALYRYDIRQMTTTNTDPEVIHALGLEEVARIEAEQLAIAQKLGFPDLKSFRASLKTNPQLVPSSAEQIVDLYRHYLGQMQARLPELFGLLPKAPVEVRAMQAFREKAAARADYQEGTPDGSRPGIVYVNTGDYQHRTLIDVEATAYHEGVPGHHLQFSLAQTLPGLPPFRQQGGYAAYNEGWALYSEHLGKEIGFYQDPYSDYGRLSGELLRADRLVLDTGVHYQHWTRQQMVEFFHEHSSEDEPDVQAETDRYIAVPAQARAYKLGQLEITKLRQRAQAELGDRYSIRAFHDEILNGGGAPAGGT
jgi:uncharacterized protein (DUF885 family)